MTFWVAGAIVGSAVIGGIGANKAAGAQAGAANEATQLQREQWQRQQENQAPWLAAGTNALAQMTAGTQPGGRYTQQFGMDQFQKDPGYAFRMSEGMKGLDRTAAARGGLLSGSTLKGAMRYNQDMGSQEYQNAYNRFNQGQTQQWNQLAGLAGVGQTANAALGQAGQAYATNAGNYGMQGAQAQGAGYMGAANSIGNAISQGVGSYQQSNLLNALQQNPGQYAYNAGVNFTAPNTYG